MKRTFLNKLFLETNTTHWTQKTLGIGVGKFVSERHSKRLYKICIGINLIWWYATIGVIYRSEEL